MSLKNKYNVHNELVCWSRVGAQWSYFPTKFSRSTREQSAFGSFPTGRERWPQPTMVSAAGKKSLLNKEKQRESNWGDVDVSGPAVDFLGLFKTVLTQFRPSGRFSSAEGEEVDGKLWSEKTQRSSRRGKIIAGVTFVRLSTYRMNNVYIIVMIYNVWIII